MGDDRPRSRSPRRDRERKPRGGFAWKDKEKSRADASDRSSRHSGLNRGYRQRSNSPRRRDDERDRDSHRNRGDRGTRGRDREQDGERDRRDRDRDRRDKGRPEKDKMHKDRAAKVKSSSTTSSAAVLQEEMIIVHVNDRLGTKAAIPCFASDRVKEFKILVAARIGREPHEILLKRQGERPFKDQLQLVDYGVSNGVQIDLEVDTGD